MLKKVVRILKYLFLLLVLLFLLVVGAVNLPFIHELVTQKTNTFLTQKGIPVNIGKITLLINGKIGIKELAMIVPPNDTIIYAAKINVDLSLLPLLSKKIVVNEVVLADAVVNILTDTVTDRLQVVSAFNPSGKELPKSEVGAIKRKPWDIVAQSVLLKNIKFIYSDPENGILIKENLGKAEIEFDNFSILKKQIDVGRIKIDKPVGMLAIWEGDKKGDKKSDTTPAWRFSAKKLEIADFIFALDQPDIGQRIDVTLKNGNISLEKLNLNTREIIVRNIELDKPEVTFYKDNKDSSETKQKDSTKVIVIPALSWTITTKRLDIKDGEMTYATLNKSGTTSLEKWLPLHALNASFDNIGLTPAGYNLNLEEISFNLASKLKIESGSMKFTSDSLQNIGLTINLSTLINEKKDLFTKQQHLNLSTKIEGNTSALHIYDLGILSTTGLKFNLTGTLHQPLKMLNSECDLQFASGDISQNLLDPIIHHFSPNTVLPKFRPFIITGNVKNSVSNPVIDLKINSESGQIEASGKYDIYNAKSILQASFTNILLSELLSNSYPDSLTGAIQLEGKMVSGNMPEGEVFVQIDSIHFKNKTTRNISVNTVAFNNEVEITLQADDNNLNLDLEGQLTWNKKKAYSGTLKGSFDIDLYGLNLIEEPFTGKGNIESNFDYSPKVINTSIGLNNLTVSNKNNTATIKKTIFNLNKNDSIIISDLNSDFLSAHFNSRASFTDFKNAFDSTQLKTAIILDSANFINLNAITNLDYFNLDATVRDNSVFSLFYPDSTLNFSDIKIQINKTEKDSITAGTVSTTWISYNKLKSFNPFMVAGLKHNQLTFEIKTDSIVSDQAKFGKFELGIDILPSNITANLLVSNEADSMMHMIAVAAERKNELVIFKSTTPDWILNKNPYTLSSMEFLTWDKSTKTFTASLGMHSSEKHIELAGKSSEMIELDVKNIELKDFLISEIIGFIPDGNLNANIKYSSKVNDKLELALEMHQMKWDSINFDLLTANGHLIADSAGIIDSKLTINADDSLSIRVEISEINSKNDFQLKSKFNNFQFKLLDPFLSDITSNLHGTSNGEITFGNTKGKMTLNGEVRFNNFGLKIVPLETWLTIPDNKIKISENQFLFNNFTVIDSLKRPLTVNGKINFATREDIWVDLKVKADKMRLMNTSGSNNTPFYGSIIINSGLTIGGSIYSPTIIGDVEFESGTNLTYQLIQDLSVKGSQTDVTFATITDSLQIIYPDSGKVTRITKMPMIETSIRINPKSIFNVKINDLYNVDITIAGDGLLNYNMLPNNTMSLNGVYEIKTGDCKLKVTGWPLKQFKITSGSSFNWSGSVENPTLDIEATTKVKGSYVNPIDNKSRVVDFIVSMKLKNQLSDLEIIFDIQSTDQYITSVLSSLSSDEMMRQAVNLLLFETIEIPGFENSSNYLASQITSFWESQLNSLTSTTLNKTKLSFGIDTYDESSASSGREEKTSFTYEMERKFLNDRATVKISGKLNDYNEGAYQTNSLFENFIFEYALDSLNTKNIKLYQKRDYEDMLEGEVVKYGVGFLYRKNYKRLKDIWSRKKKIKAVEQKNNNN